MSELEEIEQRCKKATGGRWLWTADTSGLHTLSARRISPWRDVISVDGLGNLVVSDADKAFIAHARTDIPFLLEALKHCRQQALEEAARVCKPRDNYELGNVDHSNEGDVFEDGYQTALHHAAAAIRARMK